MFGAVIVLAFAALQVFVLPHDILKYIGYGKDTIQPYLTVDKNYDFIRINSTLRGPNPLGAYAGIVLVLTLAALVKGKVKEQRDKYLAAGLAISGMIALWYSYSRSAILGAIIGLLVVLAVSFSKLSTKVWISLGFALTTLTIGLVLLANTTFYSNVILHENPTEGNNINSNEGHVESLIEGSNRMLNQPFGAGIGSTGSASLFGDDAIIIENQYLFTAHETGWLGIGLFIAIFVMILRKLWQKRTDWLALGLFASGISLAMIGLFLPVFVDDTISIIWWGLAAIALATYNTDRKRKHE